LGNDVVGEAGEEWGCSSIRSSWERAGKGRRLMDVRRLNTHLIWTFEDEVIYNFEPRTVSEG
jgi:hypothetical protein